MEGEGDTGDEEGGDAGQDHAGHAGVGRENRTDGEAGRIVRHSRRRRQS